MKTIVAVVGSSAEVERVRATGVATIRCATPADAPDDVPVLGFGGAAEQPHVTYVVRSAISDELLTALVMSLAEGHPRPPAPRPQAIDQAGARRMQAALTASRRLAATSDLAGTESVAIDAVAELVDADRVWFLYYDGDDGALWSEAKLKGQGGDDRKATGGLAGFAARTGLGASVERAARDPRWDRAIDDPTGDDESRLMVEPITGPDGQVHAVLVAARDGRRAPFGEAAAMMLAAFAGFASPFLDQMSIHIQAQAILEENQGESIFRQEAIEAQVLLRWGDVVRVSPAWMSWTYWLLVVLLIGASAYLWIARVSTYSAGDAVIRSTTRTDVAARNAGNVTAVDLAPGDAVAAGAVIAHLDDANQRASVDHLEHEFETQLRNHLLDPADPQAESSVRAVHLQLETAKTDLEDRLVRAPTAGVMTDLRVRPGQHVEPGDIVAAVAAGTADLEVIALLPGSDRPQLAPGMSLRLELRGYTYAYQTLTIDSVSQDVISPTEARRVLGADVADSLQLAGPVVLVRGHLPTTDFEVDGQVFHYHDGMLGTAEVRVRQERLLYTLVPGMRRFGE